MAVTVTEYFQSRGTETDQSSALAVRNFKVYDVSNPTSAEQAAGIPTYGDAFPDKPGLFMLRKTAEIVDGHPRLFDVVCEYGGVEGAEENIPPTNKVGLVTIQARGTAQFDDAWRTAPGLTISPISGEVTNNNTTDIGGVRADVSGEPVSFLRRQVSLVVSENVKLSTFSPATLFSFVGRRNAGVFQGFAIGTAVYLGPSVVREYSSIVVRVEHEFLIDEYRHLRQYPARNASGIIQLATFGTLKQAEAVYWRQPYIGLVDFNAISTNF